MAKDSTQSEMNCRNFFPSIICSKSSSLCPFIYDLIRSLITQTLIVCIALTDGVIFSQFI